MALIVETGSGSTTAESYLSVADADTYLAAYGQTSWAATATGSKEIALRKATRYIDTKFSARWKGKRSNETQALDFPRQNITDYDGWTISSTIVPQKLKDATAELAFRALTEDIFIDLTASTQNVVRTKVKVGSIEEETEWDSGTSAVPVYRLADKMLVDFIHPSKRIIRA